MSTMPRDVVTRRPANLPAPRSNVIDGEARPTRSTLAEAGRGVAYLLLFLAFAGFMTSMVGYQPF